MHLIVDLDHDATCSGGMALRIAGGDIDGFLCWAHVPTLVARGYPVPEQFVGAQYMCDLEVFDDGVLTVHKERVFPSETRARAWFDYVAWCLSRLSVRDMTEVASSAIPWRLS